MAIMDWFKKAKAARKEADKPKNEYGNTGAGSKAYKEAQAALDAEEPNDKKTVVASDD